MADAYETGWNDFSDGFPRENGRARGLSGKKLDEWLSGFADAAHDPEAMKERQANGGKSKALSNLVNAGCPEELAEKTLAVMKSVDTYENFYQGQQAYRTGKPKEAGKNSGLSGEKLEAWLRGFEKASRDSDYAQERRIATGESKVVAAKNVRVGDYILGFPSEGIGYRGRKGRVTSSGPDPHTRGWWALVYGDSPTRLSVTPDYRVEIKVK